MEQKLSKPLYFRHITKAADEIVEYIKERRLGKTVSLKTHWEKFNNMCMGGIEPNTIYTVAGISGSGKSSFANSLETDLFDLNPKVDFCVLSFNFEMLSSKQVGRKLSSKMNKTTSQLYSGNPSLILSDKEMSDVERHVAAIKKYEIYYVDRPGTVDDIKRTIEHFQANIAKNRWLIVMLDHTLLTRGQSGESERATLYNLQKVLMEAKKSTDCKTTIIQLSQMNRDIEDKERIANQTLHYPMRRDIFGGDSVFQASDYVLVLHRPELLIHDSAYGPEHLPVKDYVYMHILKNREGELAILQFYNKLMYNRIENVPNGSPDTVEKEKASETELVSTLF